VQAFATGGYVSGAGTATSDSIRAYLSNGEYVMKGSTVSRFGVGALDQINQGMMPVAPMPVGVRTPVVLASNDGDRTEMREIRQAIERLEQNMMTGHQQLARNTGKVAKFIDRNDQGRGLQVEVVS